jgi:hypothetical protein
MIATCAQFVDDNVARNGVEFEDGARVDAEATAHHAIDLENLEARDQRRVWVPFHFLPGNQGEGYTERLKCRMDSHVAKDMRDHHLGLASEPFALALIGITAHVYADTFSHYGFSGVSSRVNKVDNKSFAFGGDLEPQVRGYIEGKARTFFKTQKGGGLLANIKSWVGETASGALGHGAVATYPDRPYLNWSFDYEHKDAVEGTHCTRDNPTTFLAGCRALHDMFRQFADLEPGQVRNADGRDFDAIEGAVAGVLATQGPKQDRVDAWQKAAWTGTVFGAGDEEIPAYEGEVWNQRWETLDGADSYRKALVEPIWLFYQAAAIHRTYVLRNLLPRHGLVVD